MERKEEPTLWSKGKITLPWGTIPKPRTEEVTSLEIRTASPHDFTLGKLDSGSSEIMTSEWFYVSGRITATWAERQRKGRFPSRREMNQMPNCLNSKGLAEAEWGYTPSEGLTLALAHLARQSQRYFQTYEIIILIDMLIKEGIARPGEPGRLAKWAIKSAKWAIKSGKHGTRFRPETNEKGPILANFIAEVPIPLTPKRKVTRIGKREREKQKWVPYTNRASIEDGSGTWLILVNPGSMESTHVLKQNPRGTNDVAELKALIIRPKLAKETGEGHLGVQVDEAPATNQMREMYGLKGRIRTTSKEMKNLLSDFPNRARELIPRGENGRANATSQPTITFQNHFLEVTLVETVKRQLGRM